MKFMIFLSLSAQLGEFNIPMDKRQARHRCYLSYSNLEPTRHVPLLFQNSYVPTLSFCSGLFFVCLAPASGFCLYLASKYLASVSCRVKGEPDAGYPDPTGHGFQFHRRCQWAGVLVKTRKVRPPAKRFGQSNDACRLFLNKRLLHTRAAWQPYDFDTRIHLLARGHVQPS